MYIEKIKEVLDEMGKVVVGQDKLLNRLLIGLFTGGHILLEGVPGLAKTLTINVMAKVLHLDFKRIQFTPDLLPADLIGTMIYKPGNDW
jgi:MoxR-like ATPase